MSGLAGQRVQVLWERKRGTEERGGGGGEGEVEGREGGRGERIEGVGGRKDVYMRVVTYNNVHVVYTVCSGIIAVDETTKLMNGMLHVQKTMVIHIHTKMDICNAVVASTCIFSQCEWLTRWFLMIGDTPVALGCFLSTKECFILCEIGWQGREPLVLCV